jgi:peptide/nickel transport system substrate-binding protein
MGNSPPDLWYANPVVETLLLTDINGNLSPRLATSWKVAPDNKSITFTLRQGVKFHDGTDFDADALKYLFETNAKSAMPELKLVTSVDVLDKYTARVNVTQYSPAMMSLLAVGRPGWIVSPTALKNNKPEDMLLHPVGTGPFKFQEFKRDVYVKFTRNDNYWQPGKPYLDGIQYDIIADPVTAILAFKKGDEDVAYNLVQKDAYDLKQAGYKITTCLASIYQWIPDSVNASSPWSKIDVRRAGQYAIDTQTMAKAQGYGWADGYYNQVYPKGYPAYNPDIVGYPYDPAKAKQLLAGAGYPNGFKTTLYCTSPPLGDFETATQNYLKQVGIDAEIKPLPGASYNLANQQGWTNGLFRSQSAASLGTDPGYQMSIYLSTPATAWVSVARPQDMQDLLKAAMAETNMTKRYQLFRDLCKNLIDTNALIISVWGGYLLAAKQNYVMDDNIRTVWTMTWTPENAWLNK